MFRRKNGAFHHILSKDGTGRAVYGKGKTGAGYNLILKKLSGPVNKPAVK
jgi:hypothetical protein